jgi:hypothetical protein
VTVKGTLALTDGPDGLHKLDGVDVFQDIAPSPAPNGLQDQLLVDERREDQHPYRRKTGVHRAAQLQADLFTLVSKAEIEEHNVWFENLYN